jgi:hypothetical protein
MLCAGRSPQNCSNPVRTAAARSEHAQDITFANESCCTQSLSSHSKVVETYVYKGKQTSRLPVGESSPAFLVAQCMNFEPSMFCTAHVPSQKRSSSLKRLQRWIRSVHCKVQKSPNVYGVQTITTDRQQASTDMTTGHSLDQVFIGNSTPSKIERIA